MNNINMFTTLLSLSLECIIFIYYSNSVLQYRKSRCQSNIWIIGGYVILYLLVLLRIPALNVISFIVINFIVLYIGFKDKIVNTVFRVIILTAFMMFSELTMALILKTNIDQDFFMRISPIQDFIFSIASKSIYFMIVLLLTYASTSKKKVHSSKETLLLLIMPIITCIILLVFNSIITRIDREYDAIIIIITAILILTDFVVYILCDRIIDKNLKIQDLQEVNPKDELDYSNDKLLTTEYDELKVMAHDLENHRNNIDAELTNEQTEALEQVKEIKDKTENI